VSRYEFVIHKGNRETLAQKLLALPTGWRVVFQEPKRTTDQNSRLWAMLTALSVQLPWHGQRLTPEDWKLVTMAALNQELRLVPNIHGNGFVQLGRSSSKLSKAEMSELMALIEMFAAERGVELEKV
jgi:uncharacterized protein YbdZ (MbtH family)